MIEIEKIGAKIVLINGMIFALGFLFIMLLLVPFLIDGLLGIIGIGALLSYNDLYISLVLLYLSLPFALWFFGKRNAYSLSQDKSVIKTSLAFSFGVNLIIWIVFLLSQLIFSGIENYFYLNLIVIGLIISLGFLTTCTLGFYIVKTTKQEIKIHIQQQI